ncbi:MAG: hypothetical protein M9894_39225 [Planctomycetes bacterium]|nr:hypothetical protein [Planctomycetota bacterium]
MSIAILTLLAVFSLAFVQLVNFERHASTNYVDAVRARMVARAGLQRAIAELQRIAQTKHYSDPDGDHWRFSYTRPTGAPATLELNLLSTTRPSFWVEDANRKMFNQPLVYSGAVSSTYGGDSIDVYKLKIIDAASQLNLNHPDDVSLQRMLKNLLRAAAEQDPLWTLTEADAALLATRIVDRKPKEGFRSLTEVWAVLSQPLLPGGKNVVTPGADRWTHSSQNGARLPLRDMLTCSSWVDESVIRPWNLNGDGRRSLPITPRAPVNLNTASVPVLTAVLAELQGSGRFGTAATTYESGRALAQAIRARVAPTGGSGTTTPQPFKTWYEFEQWLDVTWAPQSGTVATFNHPALNGAIPPNTLATRSTSPSAGIIREQLVRDLVKAALNPNTMLNKFGAHATQGGSRHGPGGRIALPRMLDKSDLTAHGTEGCLDSMGIFDITSLGMVLIRSERTGGAANDKHMLVVAEQTQQAVVRVYDVLRLTSQAHFEQHRAFMAAGDFIQAFDRNWSYTVPGVNRATFEGFAGWPGVTSYPVYSLARERTDPGLAMEDAYEAADWDGHLLLSNLLATRVQPMDFVVCFARGSMEAFKARAWWEPKDQNPADGTPRMQGGAPVQPTRGGDPGSIATLVAPGVRRPADVGKVSNERNPLDADVYGPNRLASTPAFFEDGSALTPSGVLIHPRRLRADGSPAVLSYDSLNLDLLNGSSIRFWVLPTDDPFVHDEEILFSWLGSRNGVARDVGFRVSKRALGNTVQIVLEAINNPSSENTVIGQNHGTINGNAAVGGLGRPDEIAIDVTPGGSGPQWTPGTWHWVVLNFGPCMPGTGMSQSATLQIDKKLSDEVINMSNGGPNNSNYAWGELHGHDRNGPLVEDGNTFIDRNGVVCWTGERFLGDWYHCDQTGTVTTNEGEAVFANGIVWESGPGQNGGEYVVAPSFPSNPFPPDSFDRRLLLQFINKSTGQPKGNPKPMQPTNEGGMGDSGWTYEFAPDEMPNFQVDVIARWKVAGYAGDCDCCNDCGTHDRARRQYWGRQRPISNPVCQLLYKGPHMLNLGAGGLGGLQMAPLQLVCDQCMGCLACRVTGPMFFGGEPGPGQDNSAPAAVQNVARAVFDNIIVKNNMARRTDAPNGLKFEDRFFETNLAGAAQSLNSLNFGAIYRRGLLEFSGARGRLGTLSWTSYPTTDQTYDFLCAIYRYQGDYADRNAVNARLGDPPNGQAYPVGDPIGYMFAGGEPLQSTTVPMETLILSIQYSQLLGNAAQRESATLYPQPMLESPVLEDVTVTLVLENPMILYAEEGVEE